jgi:uncharacterized protein YqgV (UPF0045/DUF77 family)
VTCSKQQSFNLPSPYFPAEAILFFGGNFMKASVAIQVLPAARDQEELIRIVDEVIAFIKSSGLHCHVGPFETTIEGESYDQLMDIVKECQHVAIRAGAENVSAYVKVVYRPEGEILTIDKKIKKHAEA